MGYLREWGIGDFPQIKKKNIKIVHTPYIQSITLNRRCTLKRWEKLINA